MLLWVCLVTVLIFFLELFFASMSLVHTPTPQKNKRAFFEKWLLVWHRDYWQSEGDLHDISKSVWELECPRSQWKLVSESISWANAGRVHTNRKTGVTWSCYPSHIKSQPWIWQPSVSALNSGCLLKKCAVSWMFKTRYLSNPKNLVLMKSIIIRRV